MSNPAQKRLDAMAKEKGYPNYAAMKAHKSKYQKTVRKTVPAKKKGNFLQNLMRFSNPITAGAGPAMDAMNNAGKKNKGKRQ